MREITLEVQGRCGDILKLQVTSDATPMLRLTLPALDPAEISSPAASFLRLNRDPANNVLHFLSPEEWLELESTSRGGRIAVGGSACWRQELGGKVAYLARRHALFRVSRGFQVGFGRSSQQCSKLRKKLGVDCCRYKSRPAPSYSAKSLSASGLHRCASTRASRFAPKRMKSRLVHVAYSPLFWLKVTCLRGCHTDGTLPC